MNAEHIASIAALADTLDTQRDKVLGSVKEVHGAQTAALIMTFQTLLTISMLVSAYRKSHPSPEATQLEAGTDKLCENCALHIGKASGLPPDQLLLAFKYAEEMMTQTVEGLARL